MSADVSGLATSLGGASFLHARAMGGCVLLRDRAGNEIALVARTGRVQIRVSYLVPEAGRRHQAEHLYTLVVRAVGVGAQP